MMDEYVKKQDILNNLEWHDKNCGEINYWGAVEVVEHTIPADVAPVRHGYWVIDDNNTRECHCSECEWPAPRDAYGYHREQTGYCHVCGAKMEVD